ncbi:succinate-semialdehyde dehydrogenase / glutarate-semialdehyde dehydrogenase [Fodinibius salinus]|uniref:Succinate-semialdehyde dehydrogenase / glutarate-semialdehyde dehydrogenase n=1 Tax=Fodinibius salinus TaxID=860790 RepID=A0A5D3YGD5_9BACT|nr:NAD-dependent succinate-semialdehyde dehydrogenase [Fodinibius salinus]TYP92743.1 succinate-semialdehyde dehydrogenase / glutarate-semialdehyde dehydrogenase [Fodinibius salinus]
MKSINPATEELIAEYEKMSDSTIKSIVQHAAEAQNKWRRKSFDERASHLKEIAQILENNSDEYAELMAREMGKPLPQGKSESEKCAWVCRYYAEYAEEFLEDEIIESDADKSYITYNSLGTVLAIMPWNFPFWQLFRFGAPALMAGNAVILKHAPNVTGCALAIEKIIHQAGVPEQLFRTIVADVDQTQDLIVNPGIAAVTLTGSTRAGKAVASKAGSKLKKTVLELGGSDPYIILDDADIEKAAETCVTSRLLNSGQSCIAAKRFVVVEDKYEQFLDIVHQKMANKQIGDPFNDDTDIGPMARKDLRDKLHNQVQESVKAGAKCILGGEIPDREGAFYPPTILTNITQGMPAYEEELFGPVASVIKVKNEQEAIMVANDTDYGLGAAIFSEDVDRAEEIAAKELQAGCCFINEYVKSDPRLPFGGIKKSGFGRELSQVGIKEFVNIKTVYQA